MHRHLYNVQHLVQHYKGQIVSAVFLLSNLNKKASFSANQRFYIDQVSGTEIVRDWITFVVIVTLVVMASAMIPAERENIVKQVKAAAQGTPLYNRMPPLIS